MTCNTSAVAVCCSSASCVSVISRAFSIAITACAAKFLNSVICRSVKGRTSLRTAVIVPSSVPSLLSGTTRYVRAPVRAMKVRPKSSDSGLSALLTSGW